MKEYAPCLDVVFLEIGEIIAPDLVDTPAEVIPGEILRIGNPNCRVRLNRPIHEFMDDWCQQGPAHHIALGIGDNTRQIEAFAEAMKFKVVRV